MQHRALHTWALTKAACTPADLGPGVFVAESVTSVTPFITQTQTHTNAVDTLLREGAQCGAL